MESSPGAEPQRVKHSTLQYPFVILATLPGGVYRPVSGSLSWIERLIGGELHKWSASGLTMLGVVRDFLRDHGSSHDTLDTYHCGSSQLCEAQQVGLAGVIRDPKGFKFFVKVDEIFDKLWDLIQLPDLENNPLVHSLGVEAEEVLKQAEKAYEKGILDTTWILHHPSFTYHSAYGMHKRAVLRQAIAQEKTGCTGDSSDEDLYLCDKWPRQCGALCQKLCKLAKKDFEFFNRISRMCRGEFGGSRQDLVLHVQRRSIDSRGDP